MTLEFLVELILNYYKGCQNYINDVNNTIGDSNTDRAIPEPEYGKEWCKNLDQFLFVYLDEEDNPAVYEGHYWDSNDRPTWITLVSPSLSDYINRLVDRVKNGQNPF